MATHQTFQKFCNCCNVLRGDGMSYGDYVEQLTYLLFLKMADERAQAPYNQPSIVPQQYGWPSLIKKDGDELFDHYGDALDALGKEKRLLGLICNKAQNKFQDPSKLRRLLVGDADSGLTELDRMIFVLAHGFGMVSNADIQPYTREHPGEIGDRLKTLVSHGWLIQEGQGRGTRYRLAHGDGKNVLFPETSVARSRHYAPNSGHYEPGSEHYEAALEAIAAPVREKGRAPKELVERTIQDLCKDEWLSLRTLAQLLDRDAEALRKHYITRMVRAGWLEARFPRFPNHPEQAYRKRIK